MAPQVGDKFWAEKMPQPNGKIICVDWEFHCVKVMFEGKDKIVKDYSFEDLDGAWTDQYGGTWMIWSLT